MNIKEDDSFSRTNLRIKVMPRINMELRKRSRSNQSNMVKLE